MCESESDTSIRRSCQPPALEGQACVGHWECAGPFDCRLNMDRSQPGQCVPKKDLGAACTSLFECFSDSCEGGKCVAPVTSLESCQGPA